MVDHGPFEMLVEDRCLPATTLTTARAEITLEAIILMELCCYGNFSMSAVAQLNVVDETGAAA